MIFKRFLQSPIHSKIGFVFDIDGVLFRGKTPVPGAREALIKLQQNNIPFILLTNGGGIPEAERSTILTKRLGVQLSPQQVVQGHTPLKSLANEFDRVLVVGTPSTRRVAEAYGFKDVVFEYDIIRYNRSITPFSGLTEETLLANSKIIDDIDKKRFDAILVFNDPNDWSGDLQIVTDLLNSDNGMLNTKRSVKSGTPSIPIYFSHGDLLWSNSYKLNRFGLGAYRLLIRTLYSSMNDGLPLKDFVLGKPTRLAYDYAHQVLINWFKTAICGGSLHSAEETPKVGVEIKRESSPFETVFMVGDNPASDITGAQNYGWSSCLVRTGVYTDGDDLGNLKPTMIVDDVYEAVDAVLKATNRL